MALPFDFDATASSYVPSERFFSVVVAVTVFEYPPVTVTAPCERAGSPFTTASRLVVDEDVPVGGDVVELQAARTTRRNEPRIQSMKPRA